MMSNHSFSDIITTCLSGLGIYVSIESVDQILNLILLIVSILNIIIVLSLRVYNAVKNKNVTEVKDAFNEAKDQLDDLKEDDKK